MVLDMSAANRHFEHHQNTRCSSKNTKTKGTCFKKLATVKLYLQRRKYAMRRGSFEAAAVSSTIGITRIRAALFINYIHVYSVFCLVVHQRICTFPAETLLMLMMLDQNFSSKRVSIFNALCSKRLGSYFFKSDHF